jgi:hypothetical protein
MMVPGHEYRLGPTLACPLSIVAALNIVAAAQNSAVAATQSAATWVGQAPRIEAVPTKNSIRRPGLTLRRSDR